jgi:hypothetical protein
MADLIEEDMPEDEDEDEGATEEQGSLVLSLETNDGEVSYEMHATPDGFEVLAIEEADEDDESPDVEHIVALAVNLKTLDESIEILQQMRSKMQELTLNSNRK